MENLIVLFGIGVGIGISIHTIWKFIEIGFNEGQRQDLLIEIESLKKDIRGKDKELQQSNKLLGTANSDCHRLKQIIKHQYRDIEKLSNTNRLEMLKVM